jgi:hypothetical protein
MISTATRTNKTRHSTRETSRALAADIGHQFQIDL